MRKANLCVADLPLSVGHCIKKGEFMIDVERDDLVLMLEAGYIYLAMTKFKEALKVFEGVTLLAPKHDVPQVAVANVLFAQGKYLESIRLLKKAIKDKPDSAFAYSHLGESQLFYGKQEEAQESLKKAIELEPTGKSAEFAQSLLDLMAEGYDPVAYRKEHEKTLKAQKKSSKES